MCGIVGYTGQRGALPVLLSSLERVTYRGYDSFGVALLNGHGIEVYKTTGTVEEHGSQAAGLAGDLGIGHTRWATVGGVSVANAHPHLDCTGSVAIVHNGDIDNFHHLRQQLLARGHRFRSETDSEVIAHLIEEGLGEDVVEATRRATQALEGTFAIVALHRPSRRLVVARRESPLVIGLGEGETFVASDVPAILPYTNRVIYLEDGDLALLDEGQVSIWHGEASVRRQVHQVTWSASQIDKGGYEHFMLKEIHEQPQAIRDTLAAHTAGFTDPAQLDELLPLRRPDNVLLLGCGTSYHAALLGELLLSPFLGVPVDARVASEFQGKAPAGGRGLAVAFSQSGETTDTLMALRRVKAAGYAALAVTNVLGSSITRAADAYLHTQAGPEVAVASTKTFITQVMALYLLLSRLATEPAALDDLLTQLRALPGKARQLLLSAPEIQQVAQGLAQREHMFIIAKGLDVPVALEGALKLKEVAYLHTEGYPAGELKHGPFALLDAATPVVAIVPQNEHRTRMLTALKEVKTRAAATLAIADRDDTEVAQFADQVLRVPSVAPLLAPVLHTMVLQLLSYYCAQARGCPIDRPRNLAKSVTVP